MIAEILLQKGPIFYSDIVSSNVFVTITISITTTITTIIITIITVFLFCASYRLEKYREKEERTMALLKSLAAANGYL